MNVRCEVEVEKDGDRDGACHLHIHPPYHTSHMPHVPVSVASFELAAVVMGDDDGGVPCVWDWYLRSRLGIRESRM